MVKSTKTQRLREKIKAEVKQAKQSTIDDISYQFNIQRGEETKPKKAIIIDDVVTTIKENELLLKTEFKLLPSPTSFSKINLDLYFQERLLKSTPLDIPQSTLLNENLQYPQILDMKGIAEGNYLIRAEMYEPWPAEEKLCFATKEIAVQHTPQTREPRLIKIPTVKSSARTNLDVVSSKAKNIYKEIDEDQKKESLSKRDEW
jgi:hypothetical protein